MSDTGQNLEMVQNLAMTDKQNYKFNHCIARVINWLCIIFYGNNRSEVIQRIATIKQNSKEGKS